MAREACQPLCYSIPTVVFWYGAGSKPAPAILCNFFNELPEMPDTFSSPTKINGMYKGLVYVKSVQCPDPYIRVRWVPV